MDLPSWLKSYLGNSLKVSCLFGEHLLSKYPHNPVALVEAPKTAIYGALYFGMPEQPENFVWLSVYNKSTFSFERIKVLQGRDVFVFPDLSVDGSTFNQWEEKARQFEKQLPGTRFLFSDLLEKFGSTYARKEGYDLADFLACYDWKQFRPMSACHPGLGSEPAQLGGIYNQISETAEEVLCLKEWFNSISLPDHPVRLNDHTKVVNLRKFIDSHFIIAEAKQGNALFKPYLDRIKELKRILSQNVN
jgi:hypothetical protein